MSEPGITAPADFTAAGKFIEETIDTNILPSLIPWEERVINNVIYRISPPIVHNDHAVRLAINRDNPISTATPGMATHMNAMAIDLGPNLKESPPRPVCLMFPAGVPADVLESIQALWDAAARAGVRSVPVTDSWIVRVFPPDGKGIHDPRLLRAFNAACFYFDIDPICIYIPDDADVFSHPLYLPAEDRFVLARYFVHGPKYALYSTCHEIIFSAETREITHRTRRGFLIHNRSVYALREPKPLRGVGFRSHDRRMNTAQAKSIPSQYWGKKFVEKSSWTERVNGGTNGFSYSFLHLNVFFVLRQPKTILEEIQYLHGYGPCYSGKVHIRG